MQDYSSSGTSSQTGIKSDTSGLAQEKMMKLETQMKNMTKEVGFELFGRRWINTKIDGTIDWKE